MANVYRMSMSATYYFNIKADSEDDALDWCRTHDFGRHICLRGLL